MLLGDELTIRLGFFLAVFTLLSIGEKLAPRRRLTTPKFGRWGRNLFLLGLNPASVRLVFPLLPVGMAIVARQNGWGFLNSASIPYWMKVAVSVVALDFVIYLQHVLHHAIPALWRLHMVHHADLDFDLTTGVRFHPVEIVISMAIKVAAVAALGPPPVAVLIFEVALNSTSMFNHSNVRIPSGIDRVLRLFVVTPDMHRVHHSVIVTETNSNFGFNLPWWDRLLGTYRPQPRSGHEEMVIGLAQFRDPGRESFWRLLVLPFREDPGRVPINRH